MNIQHCSWYFMNEFAWGKKRLVLGWPKSSLGFFSVRYVMEKPEWSCWPTQHIITVVIFHWIYLCLHVFSQILLKGGANSLHHSKWTALSITDWPNLRTSLFVLILLTVDLNQTWYSRQYQVSFMGYWDQGSKEHDALYLNLLGFYLQFLVQTYTHTSFIYNVPLTPKYQASLHLKAKHLLLIFSIF